MARLGLDYALDSLGGALGGAVSSCDFSTYFNGTDNVNLGFINQLPQVGPLRFRSDSTPVDNLTGNIVLDFTKDDDFNFMNLLDSLGASNPYYFEMYNSVDATQFIRGTRGSGESWVILVKNGTTTKVSTFASSVIIGQKQTLGFDMTGPIGAKVINSTVDGVGSPDSETLDMTGVTLDRIVFGKRSAANVTPIIDLFNIQSTQLGSIEIESRLWVQNDPKGNTFTGTNTTENPTGVILTLSGQSPRGEVFPYELNGIPVIWNTAYLVSDTPCAGNNLVTNNGIAVTNNGEFVTHTP